MELTEVYVDEMIAKDLNVSAILFVPLIRAGKPVSSKDMDLPEHLGFGELKVVKQATVG